VVWYHPPTSHASERVCHSCSDGERVAAPSCRGAFSAAQVPHPAHCQPRRLGKKYLPRVAEMSYTRGYDGGDVDSRFRIIATPELRTSPERPEWRPDQFGHSPRIGVLSPGSTLAEPPAGSKAWTCVFVSLIICAAASSGTLLHRGLTRGIQDVGPDRPILPNNGPTEATEATTAAAAGVPPVLGAMQAAPDDSPAAGGCPADNCASRLEEVGSELSALGKSAAQTEQRLASVSAKLATADDDLAGLKAELVAAAAAAAAMAVDRSTAESALLQTQATLQACSAEADKHAAGAASREEERLAERREWGAAERGRAAKQAALCEEQASEATRNMELAGMYELVARSS
jgi:hypothetical protein